MRIGLLRQKQSVRNHSEANVLMPASRGPQTETTRLPPLEECPCGRVRRAKRGVHLININMSSSNVPMSLGCSSCRLKFRPTILCTSTASLVSSLASLSWVFLSRILVSFPPLIIDGRCYIIIVFYAGNWQECQQWLERYPKCVVGLTPLVCFAKVADVREVAAKIPLDRLVLETDSPYFVPPCMDTEVEWSHPGLVIHAAAQVAALKGMDVREVIQATGDNARRIYGLADRGVLRRSWCPPSRQRKRQAGQDRDTSLLKEDEGEKTKKIPKSQRK
jgi:hypothetical protein